MFSDSLCYRHPPAPPPSLLPPWLTPTTPTSQSIFQQIQRLSIETFHEPPFFLSQMDLLECKNKHSNFEQYARLLLEGPKIASFETASDSFFVIYTSLTTNDHYFRRALSEACDAFSATMKDLQHTQKLQQYDPTVLQFHAAQQHPFYG